MLFFNLYFLLFMKTQEVCLLCTCREEGAKVVVGGSNWNEANEAATRCLQNDSKASFVHPYAQETTWQGHSSIVDEVKAQLEACHELDDKVKKSIC